MVKMVPITIVLMGFINHLITGGPHLEGMHDGIFFHGAKVYPLVNCPILLRKDPPFMGKLTISMAMFNSFLYVYQRVVSPQHWGSKRLTSTRT